MRAAALALLLLVLPARARAHAGIDAARARYEQGDFASALADLERAERGDDLTLDDLIALLELRVLAHRALGDEAAADRALHAIAALRPEHALGGEIPPVLRERFALFARASSGPPRVEVGVDPREGGVTLTARAEGDDESTVRRLVVRARADGGAWREGSATLEVSASERVEYEARALGPGGAVLAEAHGEHAIPRAADAGSSELWPWLVAGGAILVVGAAIAIGVVAASGVDTRVEGPVIAGLRF